MKETDFPIYRPTFVTAIEDAREISRQFPDLLIHVFRITIGGYWIDNVYLPYDGQRLILTLKNGEKGL